MFGRLMLSLFLLNGCSSSGHPGETSNSAQGELFADSLCSSQVQGFPIDYDSRPTTTAAAVTYSSHIPTTVRSETIAYYGNTSFDANTVTARTITRIADFKGSSLNINAASVGTLTSYSVDQFVAVSAHSLSEATGIDGVLCIGAQTIGSLSHMSRPISIYGRTEKGARSKVTEVRNLEANLSFHDVDVDSISEGTMTIRIENGKIKKLTSVQADIYLFNAEIESIQGCGGTLYISGTSKIPKDVSGFTIVRR